MSDDITAVVAFWLRLPARQLNVGIKFRVHVNLDTFMSDLMSPFPGFYTQLRLVQCKII